MLYFKTLQKLACLACLTVATACTPNATSEVSDKTNLPKEAAASGKNQGETAQSEKAQSIPANNNNLETAQISFEKPILDFGEISAGEKINHKFKFKNVGKTPLIIQSATGSCGCTVPSFSKEPIQPNQMGEIAIVFDSAGKEGSQTKTVTVTANTEPATTTLTINGFVKGKTDTKGPLVTPNK